MRLNALIHFDRVAFQRPSALPSTFILPFPVSPSNHPASVAVTDPGCSGHVPLKESSTYPLRHRPVTDWSGPKAPDQMPASELPCLTSFNVPAYGPASVANFTS